MKLRGGRKNGRRGLKLESLEFQTKKILQKLLFLRNSIKFKQPSFNLLLMKAFTIRNIAIIVCSLLIPLLGLGQTYNVTTLAGGPFLDGPALNAKFYHPFGTAVDTAGNVYVADVGNNRIRKISPTGVVTTFAGSGTAGYADGTGTAASFNSPTGIALDSVGNVYVADSYNHRIRKISPTGIVTTLAGSDTIGYTDGLGTAASFHSPCGVAIDARGNVYLADAGNNRIRKISPTGVVTTFAGSGTAGYAEGSGTAASFNSPTGIALDGAGNVYVADSYNHRIRKISPTGVVTTLAGSGTGGYADGTGTAASFNWPKGVAVDGVGNVYVADQSNNRIRKVSPAGLVTSFAGSATSGFADGLGTTASFDWPSGIAIDGTGNIYVADQGNNRIRKISPAGVVTTLAGSEIRGFADGTGNVASFDSPGGVAVDGAGNVYAADQNNNRIRKISPLGIVTTLAGSSISGFADGTGTDAYFRFPHGVAVDGTGNVYVADQFNHRIRIISPAGVVTTLAGSGTRAFADGTRSAASFWNPVGVAVDGAGNVYVADRFNNRIRKISPTGVVTTLAGSGSFGFANGMGTAASFANPSGVAVDGAANVYVADAGNNRIRKISPAGVVTTLAGSGTATYSDGTGTAAAFNNPYGVALDGSGNVYVTDYSNNRIRKISPAGVVTTLAGSGTTGYANGIGTAASFYNPIGIAVDGADNIYVADAGNHVIRKLTPQCTTQITPTISGYPSFCQGSYTQLTSSSPIGNLWSTGDTTRFINIGAAGTYTVRVISGACTSAASQPFLVSLAGPSPTTINFDTTSSRCFGARIQLTPAGNYTHYAWNTGETTRSILVRQTGTYSVQVANADSCFGLPSPPIFIAFDTNWCTVQIFRLGVDSLTASVWADSYIWYLDGIQLLTNNSLKTIPIQGNGVYTFRAVIGGRISPLSNPIVITSANQALNAPKLSLYPNPTTGVVTLTTTSDAQTVSITNMVGQLVYTAIAQEQMELNLSHLAKGMYLVKVKSNKGLKTERLVIR